jgi:hypothetical protein
LGIEQDTRFLLRIKPDLAPPLRIARNGSSPDLEDRRPLMAALDVRTTIRRSKVVLAIGRAASPRLSAAVEGHSADAHSEASATAPDRLQCNREAREPFRQHGLRLRFV